MYRKLKTINNLFYTKFHTSVINLNKYTNTVLLPKTKFPQKLIGKKVSEQNKHVYEKAGFGELYSKQKSKENDNEFILHDGPPYANGAPHMGHAINKILKDIINRYNILNSKKVHYIPGWDCHGLPIELKALSKNKKVDKTPLYIRSTARDFATKTIEEQRNVFKSWGVIADWEKPYLTYSVSYVQNQLKQFYKLYNKKLIYRDVKPVYWSPSSRTALAEAELEYNENHRSTATIVRFKISKIPENIQQYIDSSAVYALIWTTTPWTIPSNQAICYNPDLSYSLVKSKDCFYVIATDLVDNISKLLKVDLKIVTTFTGQNLQGATYEYPFKTNEYLPFLPGKHPTASKGTGLVHTAPAHGPDDFILALNNKIPIKCIVNEAGCYTEDAEEFKGLSVLKDGSEAVIKYLKDDVLSIEDYIHSYPYDWRTKKPIILRASQQWFIDTNSIKDKAIELLEDIKIYPEKNSAMYKNTFISQLKKRPYWCISRQRVWGVPIPVFYNIKTKQPIISESLITHLCELLAKNGTDVWWTLPKEELLPENILQKYNLSINDVEKGQDILDIWFDSGISWSNVLGDEKIADLYLEGVDQFTGWFQSSLLTSVALNNRAPYKSIYVHGFAVDEKGHKMSKSLGNVVNPQDIINGGKKQPALGIDTLRWWVACHASQNSTAFISQNILQASADEVQKIRNTLRFAVGALNDYNNSFDIKNYSSLKVIDKYLLHLLHEFVLEAAELYNEYQFNHLCINVINFITNAVSALYYSAIKDRLYCDSPEDMSRISTQFVLNEILNYVSKIIGPIMPHLVEELYMYRTFKDSETFFMNKIKTIPAEYYQPEIEKIMEIVLNIKKDLNKQTVNTLELHVDLEVAPELFKKLQIFKMENEYAELADIFQISKINVQESTEMLEENYKMSTKKTNLYLCPRCRRFSSITNEDICSRCINVLNINKIRISV